MHRLYEMASKKKKTVFKNWFDIKNFFLLNHPAGYIRLLLLYSPKSATKSSPNDLPSLHHSSFHQAYRRFRRFIGSLIPVLSKFAIYTTSQGFSVKQHFHRQHTVSYCYSKISSKNRRSRVPTRVSHVRREPSAR